MAQIVCESRIEEVAVHHRGAIVSRRVLLPETISDGEVELVVPGLAGLFEDGSLRAELVSPGRRLVGLHASETIPADGTTVGPSVAEVEALGLRLAQRQRFRQELESEHGVWSGLELRPRLRLSSELGAVAGRVTDALAVSGFLRQEQLALDGQLLQLGQEVEELERQLEAARLALSQAPSGQQRGTRRPERQVALRLGGAGPVESLWLRYVVKAARWWPVYTLRVTDGAPAEWVIEAQLVQRSGEDWSEARLSLSTADLIHDARLPELPALRLGRAQATQRRGYRAAPDGLPALFAGYERAFGSQLPEPPPSRDEPMAELAFSANEAPRGQRPSPKKSKRAVGGLPPAPRASAPAPAMPMAMGASAVSFGRAQAMEEESVAELSDGGAPGAPPLEPEVPGGVEPGDAWLDFDRLMLADNSDAVHRGRLTMVYADDRQRRMALAAVEAVPAPGDGGASDGERGQFDHVFVAEGRAEVPSDGQAHRALVGRAPISPTLSYRAVPREAPEVYRQLGLVNPFSAPLLGGPVEVYFDGDLISTAQLSPVDRGGAVTLGLGVEDRLKLARRAEHQEHPAGLLGGSSVTETTVTVTLRSSLSQPVSVQLLDRHPVSDDEALEIKLKSARPKAEPYDQADRAAPVRGGLRFAVEVPAGGKAEATFSYTLSHSAKSEIVGGNRRD